MARRRELILFCNKAETRHRGSAGLTGGFSKTAKKVIYPSSEAIARSVCHLCNAKQRAVRQVWMKMKEISRSLLPWTFFPARFSPKIPEWLLHLECNVFCGGKKGGCVPDRAECVL